MAEKKVVENAMAVMPEGSVPRSASREVMADQKIYIRLRGLGYSDIYLVDHWDAEEIGLSQKYSRYILQSWRKRFREPIRVEMKEAVMEMACAMHVATIHRVGGMAYMMQGCMDELKRREALGGDNAFRGMSTKELIQEYRGTAAIVGTTLRPYETDVNRNTEVTIYNNFYDKVSMPVQEEVIDGDWVSAEEGEQGQAL